MHLSDLCDLPVDSLCQRPQLVSWTTGWRPTDCTAASASDAAHSEQGPTLSLVVAGGWIESLYIVTSLGKYEPNSPLVNRVADQKYTLENLIEFLKKYESDASVASVLVQFKELLADYDKISEKDVPASAEKSKNKNVLAGGKDLVISADQYKTIVAKVKAIRNSYTLTK